MNYLVLSITLNILNNISTKRKNLKHEKIIAKYKLLPLHISYTLLNVSYFLKISKNENKTLHFVKTNNIVCYR